MTEARLELQTNGRANSKHEMPWEMPYKNNVRKYV